MSVDSELYRLTAEQLQDLLNATDFLDRPALSEFEFFNAAKDIPDDADVRHLYINEHFLGMLARVYWDDNLLNKALIETSHYHEEFSYLHPEEVQELAAELKQISPSDLRELLEIHESGAEDFAANHSDSYPDVNSLWAVQSGVFQRILRFYERAADAGDAVLIQFG